MRVALYYPWVYLTSGAERTILELTGRSRHDWTIFTSHYDPGHTFPGFSERRVTLAGCVEIDRNISAVARAASRISRLRLPLEQFDLLVVVCEGLGDLVVFRNSTRPVICICLTPLRLAFDEAYRQRTMQGRGWFQRLLITSGLRVFRLIDRIAWRHYRHVFCISEETRRRVLAGKLAGGIPMEVLHVGLGFEPGPPSDQFDRYFLLPGRIMWTKNIELGIKAFQQFRSASPEFSDFRLVIAGIVDRKSEAYYERLRELAAAVPGVEFRILPSDAEMSDLYRKCYAVLFTAFNEDWGIVPLEGMAFGKPVVAVNRGGPRESVINGVDGFLEEPEAEPFAQKMRLLVSDPTLAQRMGRAGNEHCRRFSWGRFTSRIDDEIERLAARQAASAHVAR